jgi:hypothetical protein
MAIGIVLAVEPPWSRFPYVIPSSQRVPVEDRF